MFFGDGRKHFLEFLRNLTPQILFLSISIVIYFKLDWTHIEFSKNGLINAITFYSCVGIFLGASFANITTFIENSIKSNSKLDEAIKELPLSKMKALKKTYVLISAAWKHNKIAFLNICIVMLIIEFAFIVVVIVSAQAAIASPFLKTPKSTQESSTMKSSPSTSASKVESNQTNPPSKQR